MDVGECARNGKPGIVLIEIVLVKIAVGLAEHRNIFSSECFDEPVLMCSMSSFYASFGLR